MPHAKWLYEYIFKTLDKSFTVESQAENLKFVGPDLSAELITDYATSKADLVIMRNGLHSNIRICFVSVVPEVLEVSSIIAEIKESDETEYPVWECFRNMSAIAAKITMNTLKLGYLVNCVVVYGIVVQVKKTDSPTALKYIGNFESNTTTFFKAQGKYPFHLLLNAMVTHLQ